MKATLKPANSKARALLRKLQALADRGIDGERLSAQTKMARLKMRFDFGVPLREETPDLFFGKFAASPKTARIYSFERHELDVANAVKWALESATKISCLFRDGVLLAEATPATANRLRGIADHIAQSFRLLIDKFSAVEGVGVADRAAFVMGLYDGMMNETRNVGQALPSRRSRRKPVRGKKSAGASLSGLHIHPYSVAVDLGKQIRISAPLEQIAAELRTVIQKHLAQ